MIRKYILGVWKRMSCKRCGYQITIDICGCITPLCNPPFMEHDWEVLDTTLDKITLCIREARQI